MSVLGFFVRPTLFCAACGCPVQQEISAPMHMVRTVMCVMPTCSQFKRPATIVDQNMVVLERASDVVADPHGNH